MSEERSYEWGRGKKLVIRVSEPNGMDDKHYGVMVSSLDGEDVPIRYQKNCRAFLRGVRETNSKGKEYNPYSGVRISFDDSRE